MSLNTTPRTWAAGETVTATQMNTEVRDAFTGIQAAWTSYTPTWTTTGTAPSLGNGALAGSYIRFGKTVHFKARLAAGSTTTFGTGSFILGLPVALNSTLGRFIVGHAVVTDSGTGYYVGLPAVYSSDAGAQSVRVTAAGGSTEVSATYPMTWATSDSIVISGTYEAA